MSIINAVILGLVQGLTEFLPVSSSGHLVLLHRIFGITEPTMFFDVMLHAGTLLAVFVVLRRDILALLRRPIQPLTGFLIMATIPAVITALAFRHPIEQAFETGQLLGFSFLVTAALLCAAELLSRRASGATGGLAGSKSATRQADEMNWRDALTVGALQAIALVPGISRSGATITGALSRRLNRDFAARFSFLLSIPAILGALLLHVRDLVKAGHAHGMAIEAADGTIGAAAVAAGTLSAAFVGYLAVRFMLKIIREKSLYGFAVYTALLGILVLTDQFVFRFYF